MQQSDLYAELGVGHDASAADIKSAYRKLARELHPDRNPDDPKAEDRFKRVSYAHHVLSDPKRRKLYDEFGEEGLREGFDPEMARQQGRWTTSGGASGFEDFLRRERRSGRGAGGFGSLEDLFGGGLEDLFGGFAPAGQAPEGGVRRPGVQEAEITIEFEEALHGTEKSLTLRDPRGERNLRVRIPAGVSDRGKVRLREQGAMGASGQRGDLVLHVHVRPHAFYRREGLDLHVDVPVTLGEAYRGDSITIPTPTGNVSMKVPTGVEGGAKLRLRGRGVAKRDGTKGDLFAHIQLRLPKERSERLDALFAELDEAYGETPVREGLG